MDYREQLKTVDSCELPGAADALVTSSGRTCSPDCETPPVSKAESEFKKNIFISIFLEFLF